jgi:hypothetical protein
MAYWVATLALIVMGFLTCFSIGVLLLPIGLAMAVLGPFRHRPLIFWPLMTALLAFLAGYVAVAPLICAADGGSGAGPPCSSLIGIWYTSPNPSLLPAVFAGLALAAMVGVLVLAVIERATGASSRGKGGRTNSPRPPGRDATTVG